MRLVPLAAALLALLGACAREKPIVLYDFEDERDLDRIVWRCHDRFALSEAWAASGRRSLRCDLPRETYPGVRFVDFESDWSGYETLSLHIRNEGDDALDLVVRVDDPDSGEELEERYNGRFDVPPGESRIEIALRDVRAGPEGRELDLSRIRLFMVFLRGSENPPVLYLDRIALD